MSERIWPKQLIGMTVCLIFLFIASTAALAQKDKLAPQEQKVLDYLVGDWGNDYSVTTVDVAMVAVGVKQSDEMRFRIGSYIKAHPELHEVIRRWGWVTLVLTADEKLVARALVNAERESKPSPNLIDLAKDVGASEDQTKRGLAMLERYEIIKRDKSVGGAGYKVTPRYVKWEPRLDFVFHTVTLASGRQLNTN